MYEVVTPDFLWSFHDGVVLTKSLTGPASISEHLAEQKALFSVQRFHDVVYHHAGDFSFMTFRVSETQRANSVSSAASRAIVSGTASLRPRMSIASQSQVDRYEVRG